MSAFTSSLQLATSMSELTHGFVTWAWHLPVIVAMGFHESANPVEGIALVLAVSLIPTVLHAVVIAYLWKVSGSLAVATVYHAAFDEVRDALVATVGLGVPGANWQTVLLTLLGVWVLRRRWSARPKPRPYSSPIPVTS